MFFFILFEEYFENNFIELILIFAKVKFKIQYTIISQLLLKTPHH